KDVKNSNKYAIILGNEGNGISDEISSLVDKNIYIKMNDKCESLNVAVSGSIILYELNK
ncbi:MAG: RNA methyltransferase, partial [Bacilli bacterium]|nr:RNA methyltransferase [Bacilli bacterium]